MTNINVSNTYIYRRSYRRSWVAVVGIAVVAGSITVTAQAAPNVRPGLWETTITSNIPGMPMAPPPVTHQSCITHDDLTQDNLVPRDKKTADQCSRMDHKVEGDTVTWVVECEQQGMKTVGTGRITYVGDTYTGLIEMTMQGGPGGSMKMTQQMQGRRIGDCK